MHLRSFNLSDFGCFHLTQMRPLEDGLVVIGGPQRAGKTTFMQAIRQLGPWGVKRGDDLPPPADEYRLSAELEFEDRTFSLTLNGHATPTLGSQDDRAEIDIREMFRDITRTQYEQVFTISLAELKRLPDGVDSKDDLSEVLLGAAYGDVAVIPRMEQAFDQRANEIGRSYGRPTKNSLLRAPMDVIEDGIELRDAALGQIGEYEEVHGEYTELLEAISEMEADIDSLNRQRQRFSVIESEYADLRRYQQLDRVIENSDIERAESLPDDALRQAEDLRDERGDVSETIEEAHEALDDVIETEALETRKEAILDREEEITTFQRERSGWKERVKNIRTTTQDLVDRRRSLESDVSKLHESWAGDFTPVKSIETDRIHEDRLRKAVETYTDAEGKLEEARSDLEEKKTALTASEERLEELRDEYRTASSGRQAIAVMGLAGLLAVSAAVVGFEFGYAVAGLAVAIAILGIGLYYASQKVGGGGGSSTPVQEERAFQNQLRSEIEGLVEKIDSQENRREGAADDVIEAKETLGLPTAVSPEGTWDFYEDVADLQLDIQSLEADEEELEEERVEMVGTIEEAASVLDPIMEHAWDADEPIETAEALFEGVDQAQTHLGLANALREAQEELAEVHEEVDELIEEWDGFEKPDVDSDLESDHVEHLEAFIEQATWASDILEDVEEHDELVISLENRFERKAVQEAFEEVRTESDDEWVTVLEREAEEFVDRSEVEEKLAAVEDTLDDRREELKEKNKEKNRLETRLEELKSDDDIVEARLQISNGRAELRRLGEAYAVNRLAEHLTERLHERFLEQMAGPLIDEAGEIFKEITQEYDGIAHTEQLDDLDFEALRDEQPAHQTGELSRATTEQLFLAVRLARIRQLETSLPVVIDDSMTNFDPAHGARAVQTINELAKTNQVFFLTCHPEQLALLDGYADVTQYWCLENGAFDGPHEESTPVYDLLHVQGSEAVAITDES